MSSACQGDRESVVFLSFGQWRYSNVLMWVPRVITFCFAICWGSDPVDRVSTLSTQEQK